MSEPDGLIALQREYIRLRAQAAEQEAAAKETKADCYRLETILAERMAAIGQSHTIVNGMRLTVRTTPRITKRSDVPMDQLCEGLKMTDLAPLVKLGVHAGSLQAACKELIEECGDLPAEIAGMLKRWDQTVVAVTKG